MIKRIILSLFLTFSLVANAFGASISTLTDNFNDNSIDAAKWVSFVSGTGSIAETNSQLELTVTTSAGVARLRSVSAFDLTGSSVTAKIIDIANYTSSSLYFAPIWLRLDGSNEIAVDINEEGIRCRYLVAEAETISEIITYVPATHKYLRIREASGTIYWDYSTDGITWTNITSAANPITITSLYPQIELDTSAEASTTTAKVDDFNILPSARKRIRFIE